MNNDEYMEDDENKVCPMMHNHNMIGKCPMMDNMPDQDKMMPPMVPILADLDDEEDNKSPLDVTVNEVLDQIEKNNPEIYRIMRGYGIPLQTAEKIIKRIVRLSFIYSRE